MSLSDKGLKFSCIGCHACCRHDPGFVYLSLSDIERLSTFLKKSRRDFLEQYCRPVAWRGKWAISLQEKENFDCIFWDQGCKVYSARPIQCSTYPFWDAIVSKSGAWQKEALCCPGINQGKVHSQEDVNYQISLQRGNTPLILDTVDEWPNVGV